MKIDADALITELQKDVDDYRGKDGYDGVILGLNIAVVEVKDAVKAAEKRYPDMKLTENELALCRMTGAKWLARDDDHNGLVSIYITEDRPPQNTSGEYVGTGKLGLMDARVFPSLERGDCIKVSGNKPK